MPWPKVSVMDMRSELVRLSQDAERNVSALSERYGISRTTAYKWLKRFAAEGTAGLSDRSRRPHHSPGRTPGSVEAEVLALRDRYPAWGGRKLRRRMIELGASAAPSESTITEILRRHGRLDAQRSAAHRPFERFEKAASNELWQMDFKGHFATRRGRCHPLTVIDDHSRFALALQACPDERTSTVQQHLTSVFRRYGLPWRILADNGAPWAGDADSPHTKLTVWMLRLDVAVSHGRPYHPQTQGKVERFHRSLVAEVLQGPSFDDLEHCQRRFEAWRHLYNTERPHQAIGLQVPIDRYRSSQRPFPETLPPLEYDSAALVRSVDVNGRINFHRRLIRIGKAFIKQRVAITPQGQDGRYDVHLGRHRITSFDLTEYP